MALSMISNLRMHAVSAAFGFLPAAQPNVKELQHWIVSGHGQRAHIEHLVTCARLFEPWRRIVLVQFLSGRIVLKAMGGQAKVRSKLSEKNRA
jgi:hypothetical protein